MLDFKVETFLCVAKHLNYTKAAEELGLTQPAVTQHIKALENSYRVPLFQKQHRKIVLSEEGKLLYNALTTMKHDDIFLRQQLTTIHQKKKNLLFGATLTVAEYLLPDHLSQYLKEHPHTKMQMIVANSEKLLAMINNGEIDFAIIEGYFTKSDFDYLLYSKEHFIAVGSSQMDFRNIHTLDDLFSHRLILREKGSGSRTIFEKYAEEKNISSNDFSSCIEIGNINVLKQLVIQNIGITFLYETAVQKELATKQMTIIPLDDFPLTHDICFVWRKNSIFKEHYHSLFEKFNRINPNNRERKD